MLRGLLLLLFVGIDYEFGQTIIPNTPAGKALCTIHFCVLVGD
jgi:hypothetical protein